MTSSVQALGGVDLNTRSFSILRKNFCKYFLDVGLGNVATLDTTSRR